MAIELKNKITFTKTTTMYGHTGLDADGYPTGAGNGTIKDILDLENADLKDAFSFEVDSSNNRKYILKLFGNAVANFTVPVDKFIKSVSYDESTRELVFVFYKADETEETVRVDISDLVDTYTAGLGLKVESNEFSAKIKSDESVLKVGADGLYTDMSNYDTSTEVSTKVNAHANKKDNPHSVTKEQVGLGNVLNVAQYSKTEVDTKLSGKSDTSHTHDNRYYTESEIDSKVSALNTSISSEATARQSADTTLQSNIDKKLPLAGGTMTGTLNSQSVIPKANDTYDLGSASNEFKTIFTKYISLGGEKLTGAGFHNSIFRGKDITSYYTDGSLWSRIAGSGNYDLFDDLYVGDYFTTGSATINFQTNSNPGNANPDTTITSSDTRVRYWQIAGFDLRLGVGATNVGSHHLVIVPCDSSGNASVLYSSSMYAQYPFEFGYAGSYPNKDMHVAETVSSTTYAEGAVATSMKNIFGSHLLQSSELISCVNNTTGYGRYGSAEGVSSSWAWHNVYGTLLSEVECYGSIVWTSSGCDGGMDGRGQLPLFRLKPSLISTRSYALWLRSVALRYYFAFVADAGHAGAGNAIYSRGIRPRFLIG